MWVLKVYITIFVKVNSNQVQSRNRSPMVLKLISLSGNASHLRGLLYSSVLKPVAGVLRVKFLALLIMLFIYIWTHIYVYILHVRTHTHAPQPLLSPNDAQSPAAEKVTCKECLKSSWVPYLQAKREECAGEAGTRCHCSRGLCWLQDVSVLLLRGK